MDREALAEALGLDDVTPLAGVHSEWIAAAIRTKQLDRRVEWTQSGRSAVGSFCPARGGGAGSAPLVSKAIEATGDRVTLREPRMSSGAHLGAGHREWAKCSLRPQDVKAPGPFALTSPFAPG